MQVEQHFLEVECKDKIETEVHEHFRNGSTAPRPPKQVPKKALELADGKLPIHLSGPAPDFLKVLICENVTEFFSKSMLSFVCEIYYLGSIGKGLRNHWLRRLLGLFIFFLQNPCPLPHP